MSDRVIFNRRNTGLLATTGNTESGRTIPDIVYEAVTVDVILDHNHPEYSSDGYNVGSIKVRIFSVDHSLDDDLLPWADPLDFTVLELPLIGEMVLLYKIRGNFFYTRKIPLARRIQENGLLGVNEAINNRPNNTLSNALKQGKEIDKDSHRFGEYFKPDSRVRPLKHFEGDVIFQGRMGHSIRFGSSQMDPSSKGLAPNVMLRAGQGKGLETEYCSTDSVFGLILEDINKDPSSIWMVSDQIVPLEPSTINAGSFMRSVENPPQKFSGAQIIINSDSVILNSKKSHILLFSNEGIHFNSFKDTTIDTDSNILFTANMDVSVKSGRNMDFVSDKDYSIHAGTDIQFISIDKVSLISNKIFIGSVDEDKEPMVGGTSLSVFLARLILTLVGDPSTVPPHLKGANPPTLPNIATPGIAGTAHVITPVGPGLLNPAIIGRLQMLYSELARNNSGQKKSQLKFSGAPFSSEDNYVMLSNEEPVIVKNDFEKGEQFKSQNNEWVLTDKYYRVL